MQIFGAFGIVKELLHPTKVGPLALILGFGTMAYYILIVVIVVHVSSEASRKAEETKIILVLLTSLTEVTEIQKLDFVFLMTQIRSRNLKFQNILFKIDWNILVVVRFLSFSF